MGEARLSRVLAVDPGEARIGLALSDELGVVARPLSVLRHRAREADARAILRIAVEHRVTRVVVGLALDSEGQEGPQARRALRLVEVLQKLSDMPVTTWDESGSTVAALEGQGAESMLDARAAAVILQEFLDAKAG